MTTDLVRPSTDATIVRDNRLVSLVSEDYLRNTYDELMSSGLELRVPRLDGTFWFPASESRVKKDSLLAKLSFGSMVSVLGGAHGVLLAWGDITAVPGANPVTDVTCGLMLASMSLLFPGVYYSLFAPAGGGNRSAFQLWLRKHGVSISGFASRKLLKKLRSSELAMVTVVDSKGLRHVVHKRMVDGVPVFSLVPDPAVRKSVAAPAAKSITATTVVVPFGVQKDVLSEEAMEVVSRIQVLGERLSGLSLPVDATHVVERAEADVQELVGIRSRIMKLDPETVEGATVVGTLLRIEAELKGVVQDCVEGLDRELRIQNTYVVNR
jgi:hypothetical protein